MRLKANWDWLVLEELDKMLNTFVIIFFVSKFFGKFLLTWFFCVQIQPVKHCQSLLSVSMLNRRMNKNGVNLKGSFKSLYKISA